MSLDVTREGSRHTEHGPCNRCGWVTDISRVNRMSARELGMSSRARLCGDCHSDLRGTSIATLSTQVNAWASLQVAHRHPVA